jgi:hypothetical protein
MEKDYIKIMDDLKRYLDSDEYKPMEKEVIELVKKYEINQIRHACSFVFDDKDNIIGRVRKEEKR